MINIIDKNKNKLVLKRKNNNRNSIIKLTVEIKQCDNRSVINVLVAKCNCTIYSLNSTIEKHNIFLLIIDPIFGLADVQTLHQLYYHHCIYVHLH